MTLGGKLRKTRESKEYVSDDEADGKESKSQKKPASGKGAPGGASRKRKQMLHAGSGSGSGGGGTSTSPLPSSKTVGGKRARTLAAPAVIPGAGTVVDVSPAGMNCLIRALMRSTGHLNPEPSVAALRAHLIGAGFAITGAMLDAAGGAGMVLFTEMQRQLLIAAGRGIIVYSYNIDGAIIAHTIVPGGNPGEENRVTPAVLTHAINPGDRTTALCGIFYQVEPDMAGETLVLPWPLRHHHRLLRRRGNGNHATPHARQRAGVTQGRHVCNQHRGRAGCPWRARGRHARHGNEYPERRRRGRRHHRIGRTAAHAERGNIHNRHVIHDICRRRARQHAVQRQYDQRRWRHAERTLQQGSRAHLETHAPSPAGTATVT